MALNDAAQFHTLGAHNNVPTAVPFVIQGPNNISFRILHHVGSGTYGHVFLVQCQECGFRGALKIVPAVASEDPELPHTADRHVRREVSFHSYLNVTNPNLPHVVRALNGWKMEGFTKQQYLDWYKQNIKSLLPRPDTATRRLKDCLSNNLLLNIYFILMPYYVRGNLGNWLNKNPKFSDEVYEQRLSLFRDILSGVEFMHKKDLIHRRLCPDNILLSDDGHSRIRAIIGGLGRITSYGENPEWPLSKNNRNVSRRVEILGADPEAFRELFEAPEVKGTDYDKGCDYYSIGVIALQLFWNLRTRNDIVDAILCLQNDGTIGTKQDNPALPKKEFWLDVVRKQVSRKREHRYSCSDLLQMCVGLGDYEMQDVECDGEVHQTRESTTDESLALFNIASQDHNQSVSSLSASSSSASLISQTSSEKVQGEGESRQPPSTPSLSAAKISQVSSSANHRYSDQYLNIAAVINATILPKGDEWIKDELEKGRDGDTWRLLLARLDLKAVTMQMTKLGYDFRERLVQEYNPMSRHDKVWLLFQQLRISDGAFKEFAKVLGNTQPELARQIFMEEV